MSKAEDITRLDRAIKDAQIRIRTILTNVEALNKEIDILATKGSNLEENVKCLKKNKIIAMAQEFKKSKDELKRIHVRIITLTNDRDRFVKTSDDMQQFIEKTQKDLDKLQDSNNNNVLQFDRSKNGQG
jgi:predicted  nucleic acid-binding Zn-ribbon protein